MSYDYKTQRARIFTEDGQVMFLQIRDQAKRLLKVAGCFRIQECMSGVTGDSWDMLACFDRLKELGEIYEITQEKVAAQHRIFVDGRG
jgi:hypothetical protein